MSADLMPFTNGEFQLDVQPHEADGFRVLAPGLARALGFREAYDLLRSIPQSEKGSELVRTPGGEQQVGYLTEAGFYRALGQRQAARIADESIRASVERFQSWVYGEVLPAIRKTGGYDAAPALSGPELLARAVLEAQQLLAAKDERIAELEPKAEVADKLLDADGDLSVRDAAQSLTRAGVKTGQQRLFIELARRRWISRAGDGRWRVLQYAIDHGFMSVLPQSHYHPKTGELVMDPPQPRVTPKGLQRLLSDFTKGGAA